MSIFEAVKQSVTTRQAAERYGIRVERNGMCRCPFHDDSTPSMKLDRRYYCFGCGATGDVIDFVSRLRGIGSKEAATLLAQDFAIPYEDGTGKMSKPRQQNTDEQNYKHMERYCFRVLLHYYRLLCRWKEDYAPQTPEDGYHPHFNSVYSFRIQCAAIHSLTSTSNRSLTISQYSGIISIPIAFRFILLATRSVVPEPMNGSSTQSPSRVNSLMNHSGSSSGKAAL